MVNYSKLIKAAEQPHLSLEQQITLAQNDIEEVSKALLYNPYTHSHVLKILINMLNKSISAAVMDLHPNSDSQISSLAKLHIVALLNWDTFSYGSELLHLLAFCEDEKVRAKVATSIKLLPKTVKHLSQDPSDKVRANLSKNYMIKSI